MAGTNILVRQKDLIAGAGISITPDTTSGNVTIASTNASIDESRLVPTGGKGGDILSYQEGADRGNGDNVRLLLQNALTDSANGNAAPAAVTTQGVTITDANDLSFDGNDSHVTAVLATDEIFAADKEWTIDFWMKPTANSSEWNYILTENTGDWGSHSIGLTWNSDDSTLEQDTGGYLASVIRSSNWPNDAVACAADQWHFVAVEKQKTSTGWSLNYYLNGAIWLQVAFTGEFVPFDSSNPFWFGGKTTDSGRWFKGEANKLRVTTGARYGGKAFAVPDRLTDYAAPAGQPVWTEGIDRSRLLPEYPANGDIPCYSDEPPAGVNYNDLHTVLLLQGANTNDAKGTKLPFSVVGSPAAQDDGSLLFAANDQIKTTSAAEVKRVFGSEFTVDLYVKPTQFNSTSRQDTNFFNLSGPSTYRVYLSNFEDGGNTIKDKWGLWAYAGEREITLNNDEWHHVAVDVYLVSGTRKYTFYYDGIPVLTANWYNDGLASAAESVSAVITFFGASDNQNFTNGYVKSLRVSDVARYKGVQFDPPADGKYLNLPAGYWGKLNKSELVQRVNGVAPDESGDVVLDASTIIDNSRLLPVLDTLPEGYEGSLLAVQRGDGKVADENTLRLMHFNDDVRDVVTDETGTLKGNASITPTGYFAGALSINSNVLSSLVFGGLSSTPNVWTIDFRVKLANFSDSNGAPLVLFGTNLNETQTSIIRVDSSYIDIQATYSQRVIYQEHSLQLNVWYHFALTYDGTTYKFYVDGKLFGSGESANQFDFTRKLWFGSFYDYSTSYVSDCTIDEFRLSNVVRWTENFTPPDKPYGESLYNWGIGPKLDESRLLPETGSVSSDSVGNPVIFKAISRIDNTYWLCLPLNEDTSDRSTYDVATGVYGTVNIVSNAPSSPGGSAFFNGSSCLHGTLPAQFGSGDFTVRFWMMAPAISSSSFPQTIFSTRQGNATSGSTFALHCTTEGRLYVYSNTNITSNTDTPFTLQPSVWYHVAVVRKSGVLTIYVNGEVYNSATFTNSLTRRIFGLGASWTGSSYSEAGTVYLTSLDVLNYAAYDGAFTTPAYQPGILAGMGYAVATDSEVTDMLSAAGIDESRLLPENPANGDIPCYSNEPPVGVNYNDANTVLLLQGSSDNTAAAPTAERLNGIVTGEFPVQEDGSILVNGTSNYITFNDADARRVFSGEFTLETYIKTTQFTASGKRQDTNWCVVYRNDTSSVAAYQWLLLSDFYADAGKFGIWPYPQMSGETFPKTLVNAEFQHVAIDVYMVDGVRKFTMYRNGVPYHTGNYWSTTPADWSSGVSAAMRLFGEGPSGGDDYLSNASVMSLRVSNIARYKGVSFDPPADGKYLNPPAGYWGKLNKNEIVKTDSNRLLPEGVTDGDIPCFDATATVGGGNDANTKALIHFDTEVKDEAAGNAAPLALSSLNATIDTTVSKFGSGSLKLTSGHVFVPISDLTAVNCVISCWVYLDSLPSSYSPLFCQDDDTAGSWNLAVDNSGIYMFCRGGASKAKQPLQAKTWYWAAIVKSGKELRFYLNGAYIYSLTDSILRFTNPIIGIGEQTNEDGRKLTGNVDEFRIQFLTADELSAWTGLTIPVPVEAYSVAQTVGEWGKFNKAELVKSVNGQTPDSSGAVTLPEATTSAAGLMAAADKAAIAGLTAQGIYPNVAIATAGSGIDYNLFKTQGTFYIPYHTAVSNGPVSAGSNGVYPGGFLSILQANLSGGTSVQQIFHQHASNNAYIRSYNGDLDIWTDWVKLIVSTDQYSQSVVTLMDFNDYRTPGGYFFYTAAHLNSPDAPSNTAGWLVVEVVSGAREYTKQTYYAYNTRKTYIRTYNNNNHTWSPWHQQLSIADITESKTSSGYFKLPGGTIVQWGEQQVTAGSYTKVVFPIVFPTAFVSGTAIVYEADVEGSVGGYDLAVSIGGGTVSGMSVYAHGDSVGIGAIPAKFIAIGY